MSDWRSFYRKYVPRYVRHPLFLCRQKAKNVLQKVFWSIVRLTGQKELIYTDKIMDEFKRFQVENNETLVSALMNNLTISSVIDIGCGPGGYLAEFQKRGVEVFGIDGSPTIYNHLQISPDKVFIHNLEHLYLSWKQFDLCLCMEVAEHIDQKYSGVLVETLCSCSDTLFFTAAFPGQGGHDHINEQPSEYWISLFNSRGYAVDYEVTASIVQFLEKKDISASWLISNALVFKKEK